MSVSYSHKLTLLSSISHIFTMKTRLFSQKSNYLRLLFLPKQHKNMFLCDPQRVQPVNPHDRLWIRDWLVASDWHVYWCGDSSSAAGQDKVMKIVFNHLVPQLGDEHQCAGSDAEQVKQMSLSSQRGTCLVGQRGNSGRKGFFLFGDSFHYGGELKKNKQKTFKSEWSDFYKMCFGTQIPSSNF